jgi:hypothetical protein
MQDGMESAATTASIFRLGIRQVGATKIVNHNCGPEIWMMRQRDKHSQSPQMQAAVKFDGAILRSSE